VHEASTPGASEGAVTQPPGRSEGVASGEARALCREARLLDCPSLGPARLRRLREAWAGVIGSGALGGPLSLHLGCLGVPQIVIDPDVVEPHNLANQMWPAASVGTPKSVARAAQIRSLNPDAVVRPLVARVEDLGLAALAGARLLITGLDGRAARLRVAEISNRLGIPWVEAAVDGSGRSLYGTVTLFDPRLSGAVCYACRYDAAALADIAREGRGPGCPSWRRPGAGPTQPTLQASAFSGVVAGLQALVATRALLDEAGDVAGRRLVIGADRVPSVRLLELAANPRCLLGHEPLGRLAAAPGDRLGDLLARAGADLGAAVEAIRFHGRVIVGGLVCPRCGGGRDAVRVAEAFGDAEVRCGCGAEMTPRAASETLSGDHLARAAASTWGEMDVPVADVVTAIARGAQAHYVVRGPGVCGGAGAAETR
jgi:molybdopterin/thiamine biosynthesis adenylyltransferase